MLAELLEVVAPVFAAAAIGLLWSKAGGHFDQESITKLILQVGIPCLVFQTLTGLSVPPEQLAKMAGYAAAAMSLFAVGGLAILRLLKLPAHTYLGPLVFTNSGNVGLPVCLFAFGEQGLALGMAYFAVSSTCHVVLGGPLFSGRWSLKPFFQSPLTWAVLITVTVIATDTKTPTWIMRTTKLLGDFTIPLMLLTLGVSLGSMRARAIGRSILLATARLAMGIGGGLLVARLFELEGLVKKVLVLEAAMPVGVLNYLFAQRYGRSPENVASLVLVSTLVAIAAIPALLAWL